MCFNQSVFTIIKSVTKSISNQASDLIRVVTSQDYINLLYLKKYSGKNQTWYSNLQRQGSWIKTFFTSIISFSGPFTTSCNNVKNIRLHVTFCKGVRASADISVQSRLCSDCTLNAVLVSLVENLFITTSTCVLYSLRGTKRYALFDYENVNSILQK